MFGRAGGIAPKPSQTRNTPRIHTPPTNYPSQQREETPFSLPIPFFFVCLFCKPNAYSRGRTYHLVGACTIWGPGQRAAADLHFQPNEAKHDKVRSISSEKNAFPNWLPSTRDRRTKSTNGNTRRSVPLCLLSWAIKPGRHKRQPNLNTHPGLQRPGAAPMLCPPAKPPCLPFGILTAVLLVALLRINLVTCSVLCHTRFH